MSARLFVCPSLVVLVREGGRRDEVEKWEREAPEEEGVSRSYNWWRTQSVEAEGGGGCHVLFSLWTASFLLRLFSWGKEQGTQPAPNCCFAMMGLCLLVPQTAPLSSFFLSSSLLPFFLSHSLFLSLFHSTLKSHSHSHSHSLCWRVASCAATSVLLPFGRPVECAHSA